MQTQREAVDIELVFDVCVAVKEITNMASAGITQTHLAGIDHDKEQSDELFIQNVIQQQGIHRLQHAAQIRLRTGEGTHIGSGISSH